MRTRCLLLSTIVLILAASTQASAADVAPMEDIHITDHDNRPVQNFMPPAPDSDQDGVPDDSDNCPNVPNPDQTDTDNDGVGDECECPCLGDMDGDRWISPADVTVIVIKLLPLASAAYVGQAPEGSCADMDDDGSLSLDDLAAAVDKLLPYASNYYWVQCPPDSDDDGIADDDDNCPDIPNPDQADTDGNGVGDACEDDIVWISINDPGVPGHEGFNGQMSKYETTNAQYCLFLNSAKADGLITVYDNDVYAVSDAGHTQKYFWLYPESSQYSQITYDGTTFGVRTRDDHDMSNHPVVYVTWHGAQAFCDYYGYRLPTEWEWQAVADYDGSYTYGCGATIDQGKANYARANPLGLSSHPHTSPVYRYPSYGYGMNDMAGNAWEWTGTNNSGYMDYRGGSWTDPDTLCTVSFEDFTNPEYTSSNMGFRVCR